MSTRRLVKLLDLVDDQALISAYEDFHAPGKVWPEVVAYIRAQGVIAMDIWRFSDRLVMIAEVAEDFPRAVPEPERNREWERLMDGFQRRIPLAGDQKWVDALPIFSLSQQAG